MQKQKTEQFLYFPQWQGGNTIELKLGAEKLFEVLKTKFEFESIRVDDKPTEKAQRINNYPSILKQLEEVVTQINIKSPDVIYTLGGDCGVELAPVSYLNQRYDQELTVLWVDAHADMNTPQSSPSSNFHGMPLRTLLGHGEATLTEKLFSIVQPEQVIFLAARDLDPEERNIIQNTGIRVIYVEQAMQSFRNILEPLFDMKTENIYLHFDLDALDPLNFENTMYQVSNGLYADLMLEIFPLLHEQFNVVGGSLLEYVHRDPEQLSLAEKLALKLFGSN